MTLTIVALGLFIAQSFAYEYTFVDLGTLPGGDWSLGMDINDSDHAAGFSNSTNGGRAFEWNVADGMTELPTLPGDTGGHGHRINNAGDVAGKSTISGNARATLWRDTGPVNLGTMSGYDDSEARGLNENPHVVGSLSGNLMGRYKAFIWLPETAYGGLPSGMHYLPGLPVGGGNCARANAINNAGQIVGASSAGGGHPSRATLWLNETPGTFTPYDLGDLGGGSSDAHGINELGQVVGASATTAQGIHAFLWLEEEAYGLPVGMNDLGSLGDDSDALAVNNHGQVVGRYWLPGQSQSHAFIWENGVMTDLDDFLPQGFLGYVETAYGINDAGHIVGTAVVGPETHAFVMIPEPSALALSAVAGLLVAFAVRRNKFSLKT